MCIRREAVGTARDRCPSEEDDRLSGRPLSRFEHEVDLVDTLVLDAIGRLSRHHPEHEIRGAALDDLNRLKPHIQVALAALVEIEQRRVLTQNELSRRRAFKTLLEGCSREGQG